MLLFDNETEIDFLYYQSIADTVGNIINDSKEMPVTIGIHGDWGAGKSSILKMIEASLSKDDKKICLKFNGWLFQGFEDAKIALMESIIHTLQSNKKIGALIADEAKSLLTKVNWLKLVKMGGSVAFNVLANMPTPEQINFAQELLTKDPIENLQEAFSILKPKEEKSIPEEMHAFRADFQKLLDKAKIKKLVVLIDDLDRCLPKTAIETLEAIRLFLFVPKTAFIIAADEGMIEAAVKEHFPDASSIQGLSNYARNYLEKLIQVPFRLPSLGASETKTYVSLSLSERLIEPKEFLKLLEMSKNKLQKPWENSGLSLEEVKETLENIPIELEERIILSEQISPMLSEGTKGNPRQIKRFINSLLLRLEIAKNRNLLDVINKRILAKLMLLEYFNSNIYDVIAADIANSSEGTSQMLIAIEQEPPDDKSFEMNSKFKKYAEEDEFKSWAKIEPLFGKEDLRPYIFISKDKRTGLFLTGTNEKIAKLYKILIGSDFEIAASETDELHNLSSGETKELFNLLANKARETLSQDKEPVGFAGIKRLISLYPDLQNSALELVRSFRLDSVGVWILGITDSFIEDHKKEFTVIIATWSKENAFLAAAMFAEEA